MDLSLRRARSDDWPAIWEILSPVFRAGETYAVDPGISCAEARAYWMAAPRECWIAESGSRPVGTYYIKPNQPGGGAHVCNCGYVTAAAARGRGIARAMGLHSLGRAAALGFAAMQFNFVVETNGAALRLWRALGFEVAGRLPGAFRHPVHGLVDALVLYRVVEGAPDRTLNGAGGAAS